MATTLYRPPVPHASEPLGQVTASLGSLALASGVASFQVRLQFANDIG